MPDALVIGAGPAGSAAAIRLAESGLSVWILERSRLPRHAIGESLPPKVVPLLSILGARDAVDAAGFLRMTGTTVFSGEEVLSHAFDPEGRRQGYQVERGRFDALLAARAQAAGAVLMEQTKVTGLIQEGRRVLGVRHAGPGSSGETRAQVVVDASGSAAVLGRHLSLRERDRQRTVALAAYWRGSRAPGDFAESDTLFEMIDDGWIWSVLRGDGLRNVTLGLDAARVKSRTSSYVALYTAAVRASKLVGPLLEGAEREGAIRAHDASWSRARAYAGEGWLLAGDAASMIDPLTSQGVFKALQSGIVAAAVVNTMIRRPADHALAVRYYEESQARFTANYASIALSFYRRSPLQDAPFWRARRESAFAAGASAEEDDLDARQARREAFVERLNSEGGDRIGLRADARLSLRPRAMAESGFIVERPGLFLGPAGEGQLPIETGPVDASILLPLLDGRSAAAAFDAYVEASGVARSSVLWRQLLIAVSNLAERSLLEVVPMPMSDGLS